MNMKSFLKMLGGKIEWEEGERFSKVGQTGGFCHVRIYQRGRRKVYYVVDIDHYIGGRGLLVGSYGLRFHNLNSKALEEVKEVLELINYDYYEEEKEKLILKISNIECEFFREGIPM